MEGGKKQSTDTHWRCKNGQGKQNISSALFEHKNLLFIATVISFVIDSLFNSLTYFLKFNDKMNELFLCSRFTLLLLSYHIFPLPHLHHLQTHTHTHTHTHTPSPLSFLLPSHSLSSASWNWRIKIPIELPLKTREMGRLRVQMWERNITRCVLLLVLL